MKFKEGQQVYNESKSINAVLPERLHNKLYFLFPFTDYNLKLAIHTKLVLYVIKVVFLCYSNNEIFIH